MHSAAIRFRFVVGLVLGLGSLGGTCDDDEDRPCGNGQCETQYGETLETCRADCEALCGNDECGASEQFETCPEDCFCGDRVCKGREDATTCRMDCGLAACGDGQCDTLCNGDEDSVNCPSDCNFTCGDGRCDYGEGEEVCPDDCSGSVCDDGTCTPGESPISCPEDCSYVCGDGECDCDHGETPASCPEDCFVHRRDCDDGICLPDIEDDVGGPYYCDADCGCGNGACQPSSGENFSNCLEDCHCGDDVCNAEVHAETTGNCPDDCHCGNGDCEFSIEHACDMPDRETCTADCDAPDVCGNGVCESDESDESCPPDCGTDAVLCTEPPDAGTDPDAGLPTAPSVTSLYVPGTPRTGESGQFSALLSGTATSYAWDFGGGATPNTSTASMPTVTFGAAGNYTVTLTASNAGGSSAPSSTPYTVAPAIVGNPPVINQVSQTGYLGQTGGTLNFNASASDVSNATWTWDFGTGATLAGPSEQFTSITLAATGVHQGRVTATTGAGTGMLDFTFIVTATFIQPPTFQTFSVASSPLASVPPSAILLSDGRPLVAYVTSSNRIAASVSGVAAPIGATSFTAHEADTAPAAAPRALAATLLGNQPVLAYLYPDTGDLVVAVAIGAAAPAQASDWAKHEVLRLAGAGASVAADAEMKVVAGRLVLAIVSDAGLRMAFAQAALPTAGTDWASHVLDASTALTDCALGVLDGAVVAYLDAAGALHFASAAVDPPTQTLDWSSHIVETFTGFNDASLTVMGSAVVASATGTSTFGVNHVHRSLVSSPTSAADWETTSLGSAFGRHSITTLDGRLAIASMTSTTLGVPYASRTVLADVSLLEAWQYRQLSGTVTNPKMGDAIGLASGRLAFCYIDAAASGSVVFTQADALW